MSFETILPFLVSFVVSLGVTPLTIWLYRKKKWLDDPSAKKHPKHIHSTPLPRGGGIPVFAGIFLAALLFLPVDKHLVGILAGALVLLITGILDDVYDLTPKLRLGIGLVAASMVVAAGIGIPFLSNPFSSSLIYLNEPQIPLYLFGKIRTIWILADMFAIFWIVGIMNFVNWSKGLDGQLPGMVGVAALIIAILSQRFSADITQWATEILALIVAGAYFGFLPWNFFPQKIMPGYGGGSLAGYFLAVLAILSTTKVGTLTIVLGVPLIDAVFVIFRRIFSGQSPLWGDTRHLHHSLLRLGWSKRRIAFFYWGITTVLGVIALKLNSQQKLYTIVLLTVALGALWLWIKQFGKLSSPPDPDSGSKT
ncbi:MAG: glycosyltransferase family 4 protein [Patescibacteria group bacterium]|jgi:UDP-GlcNAc:undecaprenyl-phosphate GlcNAc-1-phosphate transferase